MGESHPSPHAAPGSEDDYPDATDGVDSDLQEKVAEKVDQATTTDVDDEQHQLDDYDRADGDDTTTEPSPYQDDEMWEDARDHRDDSSDRRNTDNTNTGHRTTNQGVSDWQNEPVEVPDPDDLTDETDEPAISEQAENRLEELRGEGRIELGAGTSNTGLDASRHGIEERMAAESDENTVMDEALGPSGNYASVDRAPDAGGKGDVEFADTLATDVDRSGTLDHPHIQTSEYIESSLEEFGLSEDVDPGERLVSVEAIDGLDEETIAETAREYADLHMMTIAGERQPRTPGSTLSQQESIEGSLTELEQLSNRTHDLAERHGDEATRTLESERAQHIRSNVADEHTRTRDPDLSVDPFDPDASPQQTYALIEQYPENRQDKFEHRAQELADEYEVTTDRARRAIADQLLNDPEKSSVTHTFTENADSTVPTVHDDDIRQAARDFETALDEAALQFSTGSDPIPHEAFEHAVTHDGDEGGQRRGNLTGRVRGVVEEPDGDGVRHVCYLEDPNKSDADDIKLTIWESNEQRPDNPKWHTLMDYTRHSPDPDQGDHVEIENAKLYVRKTPDGDTEHVATADNSTEVVLLEEGDRDRASAEENTETATDHDYTAVGDEESGYHLQQHDGEEETEGFDINDALDELR